MLYQKPGIPQEGAAVNDCMRPDRIILGVPKCKSEKKATRLYSPFNRNHWQNNCDGLCAVRN